MLAVCPSKALPYLLVLVSLSVKLGVALDPANAPLLSGGTSRCPKTTTWAYTNGDPGAIVTSPGTSTSLSWSNVSSSEIFYYTKGVSSQTDCSWACQAWPLDYAPGTMSSSTDYYTSTTLTALNLWSGTCAFWDFDTRTNTCYLFDCTACLRYDSYNADAAHFSGKGPNNCKGYPSVPSPPPGLAAPPPPPPPPPIGVKGDPHFTGADDSHFDFSGRPNTYYCLVSDSHLHINAYYGGRIGPYEGNPAKSLTWIRQVGIMWGHHTMTFSARAGVDWAYGNGYMEKMEVDGEQIFLSQPGDVAVRLGGAVRIRWAGGRVRSGDDWIDVYEVVVKGILHMRMEVRPEVPALRTEEDGTVHFSLQFPDMVVTPSTHGVLGQTYRADHGNRLAAMELEFSELLNVHMVKGDNAEGYLDGEVDDYRASALLKADCRMTRFARFKRVDHETARAMEMSTASVVPRRTPKLKGPRKSLLGLRCAEGSHDCYSELDTEL
eukprot:TRINITY_DN10899_c0_g1_i1.p1 TRINITY_DN10899_c0_g1~~TRINITY_DN10899_c0_g1_i1.p1  ORF type:complete len:491 (-),score=39.16 TRINITY_DN10899_c0_g1_i1:1386-2858(-)